MFIRKRRFEVFLGNIKKSVNATLLKNRNVLYVSDDYWIAARGYRLYKYDVNTQNWSYWSRVLDNKYALLSRFFLTRRLFRAEITSLYKFRNNNFIAVAKKGIFKFDSEDKLFRKSFSVMRGSRPMAICQDNKGDLYFGEYFGNFKQQPIHIYSSEDKGSNWQIVYTFPQGTINHIHGIFQDKFSIKLWVLTGDLDEECIFGYTEDGFKTFNKLYSGSQKYRATVPLFYKDRIVFATDTQYEQNVIREINRDTGEIKDLCKIQGSGIYGGQIGDVAFISTTVEPSAVNKDNNSYLWISKNGKEWQEVLHFEKDVLPLVYFQFGSMRFPTYDASYSGRYLHLSGRALKNIDGDSLIIPLPE